MVTTSPKHPRQRTDDKFVCRQCRGPCRTYKGSRHGWTCETCIANNLGLDSEPPAASALPMGPLISKTSQRNTFLEDHHDG